MNTISRKALYVALVLLAAACSKSGSGDSPTPKDITIDVLGEARKAAPMSEALSAHAKLAFKADDALIPSPQLVLNNYKNNSDRFEDEAKLSAEGHDLLNDIKAKCTLRANDKYTDGEINGVGDHQTTTNTDSISGFECPIAYSSVSS